MGDFTVTVPTIVVFAVVAVPVMALWLWVWFEWVAPPLRRWLYRRFGLIPAQVCEHVGHDWWQPEGVFTARVCRRCEEPVMPQPTRPNPGRPSEKGGT